MCIASGTVTFFERPYVTLVKREQNGSEMVRTTPGIFQPVRKQLFSNAKSCVEDQGGHFDVSDGLCSYNIFFLYFGVGFFSVRVAAHFSFNLYNL